ncbi:hypothetical protein KEJ36_01820 [Candidatus Bathyarchaeota archaeon]|nr:hypothetical protein [Candidatus Bathyarchaeota archaeon]
MGMEPSHHSKERRNEKGHKKEAPSANPPIAQFRSWKGLIGRRLHREALLHPEGNHAKRA